MAGRNRGYGVALGAASMAFEGRDCLTVVTGGRLLRLRVETAEKGSTLIVEDPQERTTAVVLEGTALEVAEAFASVSRQAMPRRPRSRLMAGAAAAVVGAFLLGSFVGANGVASHSRPAVDPQDALVRDLVGRGIAGAATSGAEAGSPLAGLGAGTAVLPTPDFLVVPDSLPPLPPASAPVVEVAPEPVAPPPIAVPSIPMIGDGPSVSVEPVGEDDVSASADTQGSPFADDAADDAADVVPTAEGASTEPQPRVEPEDGNGRNDATPDVPHDPAAAKEEAEQAIGALLDRGMTTDEALGLLSNLDQLAGEDGRIDPEALKGLPHEVARLLIESGAVGEDVDAPDGVPYRIIRLPSEVMLEHVGRDGIPTIPHQNSWAATGNSVSLPLPGGGDETVESLMDFGLVP